jgi:hypothetical protein
LAAAHGSPLTRRCPDRGTELLDELEAAYAEPDDTAEE